MSLLFRMIAEDLRPDAFLAAREAVDSWLDHKGWQVQMPEPGAAPVVASGLELRAIEAADDVLKLCRQVVVDQRQNGRWTTTVTTLASSGHAWQWVDLERVADDPWGPQPLAFPPGVVRQLLSEGTLRVGSTPLPAKLLRVDSEGVHGLATALLDANRRLPIVVVSQSVAGDDEAPALRLAKALMGVVPVYLLAYEATGALSSRLGQGLDAYGGAARTYLPGLRLDESLPFRHRVLGANNLRQEGLAERVIVERLRRQALAMRPPEAYRERGRALLLTAGGGADSDVLLEEALEAEAAAQRAREEVENLRDHLDWQALLSEETEAELDAARARIRWLERELDKAGQHVTGHPAAIEAIPESVGSFAEAVSTARDVLVHLDIGDTDDAAAALDEYAQAGSWARRAWRALRALNAYASARAEGYSRDVRAWCGDANNGAEVVQANWITTSESDTTDNNRSYRGKRTFPVPMEVDATGSVYMPAHVKIVEGGRPAPRIHFYDDTGGVTGKIYVGYIGPHLSNKQSN